VLKEIDKLKDWGIVVNLKKTELLPAAGAVIAEGEWTHTPVSNKVK